MIRKETKPKRRTSAVSLVLILLLPAALMSLSLNDFVIARNVFTFFHQSSPAYAPEVESVEPITTVQGLIDRLDTITNATEYVQKMYDSANAGFKDFDSSKPNLLDTRNLILAMRGRVDEIPETMRKAILRKIRWMEFVAAVDDETQVIGFYDRRDPEEFALLSTLYCLDILSVLDPEREISLDYIELFATPDGGYVSTPALKLGGDRNAQFFFKREVLGMDIKDIEAELGTDDTADSDDEDDLVDVKPSPIRPRDLAGDIDVVRRIYESPLFASKHTRLGRYIYRREILDMVWSGRYDVLPTLGEYVRSVGEVLSAVLTFGVVLPAALFFRSRRRIFSDRKVFKGRVFVAVLLPYVVLFSAIDILFGYRYLDGIGEVLYYTTYGLQTALGLAFIVWMYFATRKYKKTKLHELTYGGMFREMESEITQGYLIWAVLANAFVRNRFWRFRGSVGLTVMELILALLNFVLVYATNFFFWGYFGRNKTFKGLNPNLAVVLVVLDWAVRRFFEMLSIEFQKDTLFMLSNGGILFRNFGVPVLNLILFSIALRPKIVSRKLELGSLRAKFQSFLRSQEKEEKRKRRKKRK